MKSILSLLLLIGICQCALSQTTCTAPDKRFTIRRDYSSYAYEESWSIHEGLTISGPVIISHQDTSSDTSGSFKTFDVCLKFNTDYTIKMADSYGDGWGTSGLSSWLTIYYNSIVLIKTTLPNGSNQRLKTQSVNFKFPIAPGTTWKYTDAPQTGNTWTTAAFPDTTWTPSSSSAFPSLTTTRYYRLTSSVIDNTSIVALDIKLVNKYGSIVYINGEEVHRINMLSGAVTSASIATGQSSSELFSVIVVPKKTYMATSSITICVETHLPTGITGVADPFDLMLKYIEPVNYGSSYIVPGTPICTPDATSDTEKCPKMFDNNLNTKFLVYGSATAVINLSLNDKSTVWFNAYSIVSGNDVEGRDPKSWKLYGSNDQANYILLDVQYNQIFTGRKQEKKYYLRSNSRSYQYFKLEILENNGGVDLQFSELYFLHYNLPILAQGVQYDGVSFNYPINEAISMSPISSGYTSYTITPALPTGITMNANTGSITGTSTVASTSVYTISAMDPVTNQLSTTTITINFVTCNQPSFAKIRFTKTNKGTSNDERFVVYSPTNAVILESRGDKTGVSQSYMKCEVAGIYKISIYDEGNNGWHEGAYLDIELFYSQTESTLISRYFLISGYTDTFYINTKLDLPTQDATWKYLVASSVIDPLWSNQNYNDQTWTALSFSTLPQAATPVVLFRKTFTISSKVNMKAWELAFKAKAGALIYINGVEVYRLYLPTGAITPTTLATGGSSTYEWKSVSGIMKQIEGNTITVAIALVNTSSQQAASVEFDAYFHLLAGSNRISRALNSIDATCDEQWDTPCSNIFDYNFGTRCITTIHNSITPREWVVKFKRNRAELINKYCIISNYDSPQHDPVDWKIYGSNDGTTFTELSSMINISWEFRVQRQCFYMPLNTVAYNAYKLQVTRASILMDSNRYALMEWELEIEDLDSVVLPAFGFTPSNLVAYKGIVTPALLVSSEYYYNFQITPALPSPLTMDTSNGYINGIPTAIMSSTMYTITAMNPSGQPVSTTITFSVITCDSPNILFGLKFVFEGAAIEASWTLKNPATQEILDSKTQSVSYSTQQFNFCKPAQVYELILGDSANDGWGSGKYHLLLGDGTSLQTGTVASGESPKTVIINVSFLLQEGLSTWQYLQDGTQAPTGWNTVSFSSQWLSAPVTQIPVPTSTTQYYRTQITVPTDTSYFGGLEMKIKTYAGLIIYLNGVEQYRVNMPAGVPTKDTLATTELAAPQFYATTIGIEYTSLVVGTNIIGVEIHKKNALPIISIFDSSAMLIAAGEYRIKDGTNWCDIPATGTEGIDKLFDNNIQTKMLTGPRCVGAQVQWIYNNERREYINSYKITNGNDCNTRHPSGWRIEGSNDGGLTWTVLHVTSNVFFTSYRQTMSYKFYNEKSYNIYQLYITECNNVAIPGGYTCYPGNLQLSEWGLYVDRLGAICEGNNGYAAAIEGEYTYVSCPVGYNGYKKRLCSNGVLGTEINECVVIAPTSLSYIGSPFTFYKDTSVNVLAIITGVEIMYQITPSLPSGILFNSATGAISGTPTSNSPIVEYTISASNSAGSVSTTILVQVTTAICPTDGTWSTAEAGSTLTQNCPDTVHYNGQITRRCRSGYPAVWENPINSCVLKTPTIVYGSTVLNGYKGEQIMSSVPTITGLEVLLSIAPALPTCLTFNTISGQISGLCNQEVNSVFTVTAQNSGGSITTQINIQIRKVVCPSDNSWPETDKDIVAYLQCTTGMTGMRMRSCISKGIGTGMAEWSTVDDTGCYVYDGSSRPGEGRVYINMNIKMIGITAVEFNTPSTYETFRRFLISGLSSYGISSVNIHIVEVRDLSSFYASSIVLRTQINCLETDSTNVINHLSNVFIKTTLLPLCQTSTDANLKRVTEVSTTSNDISITKNGLSTGVIILIVVIVVIVVIIVGIVVTCVIIRTKGSKRSGHKQLEKKQSAVKQASKKESSKATRV